MNEKARNSLETDALRAKQCSSTILMMATRRAVELATRWMRQADYQSLKAKTPKGKSGQEESVDSSPTHSTKASFTLVLGAGGCTRQARRRRRDREEGVVVKFSSSGRKQSESVD
jgi:hypothetical protein